ncbi:putative AC transposase, partial [Bienertia sinuspersici]
MMEPELCPDTLEVNMDWDQKARRGAVAADKLNYTSMLLTCPAQYGLRKKVIALDTPTRWNSTYKLLHDAIAYRDVLTYMYNESRATDGQFITIDHWSLAKIIHDILETFDNATHIFSYVYEPNIHTVKWCAYFTEFPPIYAIAALLDLGVEREERLCEDYGAVIQPQPVGSST